MLYGPWVMGDCQVVWPMGHGKKVAERCARVTTGNSALDASVPSTGLCDIARRHRLLV